MLNLKREGELVTQKDKGDPACGAEAQRGCVDV